MLPVCFIPCESMESPAAAKTVTPASTRYLRKFTSNSVGACHPEAPLSELHDLGAPCAPLSDRRKLCLDRFYGRGCLVMLLDHLVARVPQLQEGLGLFVEALAIVAVECRLAQDAKHRLRTEVILIVETMDRRKNLVRGKPGVLNVGQLMPTFVNHLIVADDEAILHRVVVKLGAGIGMCHGNLNGFD